MFSSPPLFRGAGGLWVAVTVLAIVAAFLANVGWLFPLVLSALAFQMRRPYFPSAVRERQVRAALPLLLYASLLVLLVCGLLITRFDEGGWGPLDYRRNRIDGGFIRVALLPAVVGHVWAGWLVLRKVGRTWERWTFLLTPLSLAAFEIVMVLLWLALPRHFSWPPSAWAATILMGAVLVAPLLYFRALFPWPGAARHMVAPPGFAPVPDGAPEPTFRSYVGPSSEPPAQHRP